VVRRNPHRVAGTPVYLPQRRTLDEHGADNIIVSVQIAVSDNLYIERGGPMLGDKRGYVLKQSRCQAGLDKHGMVRPAVGLYDAQVINPSVAVEVQIVNHITARVEQLLKLSDRP